MAAIEYLTVDHLSTKQLIRFFSKVAIHDDLWFNGTPCWIWCGNRTTGQSGPGTEGYGHVRYNGATVKTHRLTFAWLVHQIPKGNKFGEIDHLCRVHACCNPLHLEFTTHRTNILRSENVCAINSRKTHCRNGHPLSGDNLFYDQGWRQCRTCARLRQAKRERERGDEMRAVQARWRERNREKLRQYYRDNREVINANARASYKRSQQAKKHSLSTNTGDT